MARPVTLFTGQWADLPLEDIVPAKQATSATTAWSWPAGAITSKSTRRWPTPSYCAEKRELLEKYDLQVLRHQHRTWSARRCATTSTQRHKAILPPHVWGDGNPAGVNAARPRK